MKIVHLIAGAGRMYCGSCLHGAALARVLGKAGHDVLVAPLYTPLRTDHELPVPIASKGTVPFSPTMASPRCPRKSGQSPERVAFGGINVYLQQRFALFRHTPAFLDRWLDRPGVLRWATRWGVSTRPERLGPLTLSMLRGREGRQWKELDKLVRWLDAEFRPEVIHLSSVLLAGMAATLRGRFAAPVVCTLSGEDAFLENIPEPHYTEIRRQLRRCAAELDAMIALSRHYADFMAGYLDVPRERIEVIPPGICLEPGGEPTSLSQNLFVGQPPSAVMDDSAQPGAAVPHSGIGSKGDGPIFADHGFATAPAKIGTVPDDAPFTIGYLARICPEKGLDQLVEAWRLLSADRSLRPTRLRVAGYLDPVDRPYLADIRKRVAEAGLAERFEYLGEVDRRAKAAMLRSLDLFSLPTVQPQSKGLPVFEAWVHGIPAVLPDHGAFREMIEDTGGGILCAARDPAALAGALRRMIQSPELAAECGARARQAMADRYTERQMAQRTMELYRRCLTQRS